MKNTTGGKRSIFLLTLFIVFLYNCTRDEPAFHEDDNIISASKSTNCEIEIEFDVEIYNSQRPVNLADTSNLSSFDKIDG